MKKLLFDELNTEDASSWLSWTPWIAGVMAAVLILTYLYVFWALPVNEKPDAWGQFGDYVGGLLNPLISLFTLTVAVSVWRLQRKALNIQKQELAETREAIKQQTFDQFFMSMLASLRSMVEQVVSIERGTKYSGKHAIDRHSSRLDGHITDINAIFCANTTTIWTQTPTGLQSVESALTGCAQISKVPHDSAVPQLSYFFTQYYNTRLFHDGNLLLSPHRNVNFEQIFGHIFRSTYQILKIIDEQFLNDNKSKKRYVNLLRAQMSESEFVFFALSALTNDGKKSWARSVRLNFFEDRLQNMPWTQKLSESFVATDENKNEAETILKGE
jgi:Putative phage abortive infection protein